ncbi:uncharacterized protein RCC_10614 [Ramularia collo-cygni]|uniref:Uncharacterized protein n=1 Tax=Ramularia collo-cygni TaxID=112498 RepID=A0A2D3V674_9PEZI|nr:uncharacterized protein RCC_10614 [Ramularia collo-cygni]CZT24886.1 uncharacterized protein RCC_10614 [Ramularia collo-cygni]
MSGAASSNHATASMRDPTITRARRSQTILVPFSYQPLAHPTHWNFQQSQPPPRLPHQFNPAVTDFSPNYQLQPPPQATEPFWHQFTPGLHYSPYSGISYSMDTQTVVIGYGTKVRVGKKARINHARPSRQQEMVDVYNDECFISAVPLKTLVRFSAAAATSFPRPAKAPSGKIGAFAARSPGSSTESSSDAAGSESGFSQADTTCTQPTEFSISSNVRVRGRRRKCLVLMMEGAENPSNKTVKWALKWMMDNAEAKDDLVPYAPDLDKLAFADLLDFYQASLVLELRPIPRHITAAIMKRVSDQPPTLNMFQDLACYVPVENVVIDRAINSYLEHRDEGCYTESQLYAFEDFLNEEGKELFNQKYNNICRMVAAKKARDRKNTSEVKRGRGNSLASVNWRQGCATPSPRNDMRQVGIERHQARRQREEGPVKDTAKPLASKKAAEPESMDGVAD